MPTRLTFFGRFCPITNPNNNRAFPAKSSPFAYKSGHLYVSTIQLGAAIVCTAPLIRSRFHPWITKSN